MDPLHLIMRSILSLKPWERDPKVVQIPWRQHVVDETLLRGRVGRQERAKKPLKFGMFWNDGAVTPHPPIQRGLRIVLEVLKAAEYKVRTCLVELPIAS